MRRCTGDHASTTMGGKLCTCTLHTQLATRRVCISTDPSYPHHCNMVCYRLASAVLSSDDVWQSARDAGLIPQLVSVMQDCFSVCGVCVCCELVLTSVGPHNGRVHTRSSHGHHMVITWSSNVTNNNHTGESAQGHSTALRHAAAVVGTGLLEPVL